MSQDFLRRFAVLPSFPPETDHFMLLDVSTPQGCFSTEFPRFTIGNAYGIPLPLFPHSVSPEHALLDLDHPYLVAGDFNIHNAATDPTRLLSSKEEKESAPYFDRASDLGFPLLNTPGIYTQFPFSGTHRPGTIDLAFANPHMFSAFRFWDASSLPSTGSDHAPIKIALRPPTPHNDKPRPRWQEADWLGLTDRLKNWLIPPPPRYSLPKATGPMVLLGLLRSHNGNRHHRTPVTPVPKIKKLVDHSSYHSPEGIHESHPESQKDSDPRLLQHSKTVEARLLQSHQKSKSLILG